MFAKELLAETLTYMDIESLKRFWGQNLPVVCFHCSEFLY